MGYQKPNRTVTVTFDGEFEGAEVKATRNVTFDQMFALDNMEEDFTGKVSSFVADMVIEWNLENDDGTPTPKTGEALLANWPIDFVIALITEWRNAVFSPQSPLEGNLTNGSVEEELSLAEYSKPS